MLSRSVPAAAFAAATRRPTLAAAALYLLLAVLMVAPGLRPGYTLSASDYLWTAAPWTDQRPPGVPADRSSNGELADSVSAFQPFTLYARTRLPSAPLWNPFIGAGRPFHANAQSALFSPFTWPSLVLPFGFSLWMVCWLSWPLASVWAVLPWLLAAVDRVVRRPGAPAVACLAGVTALLFAGGHPESTFHAGVVAVLFAALRSSRRPGRGRAALAVVGGLAAGVLLAAVVLLPFLELLRDSSDVADRASREVLHAKPKYVLGLFMPEYWGRPTQAQIEPFIAARAWYAGALPLVLAGVAVLLRPTRERVALAAAAAVSLAVALGIPPVFELVTALPGFHQAANTRLGVITCLCLALLAGAGLDDLRTRPILPRRVWVWLGAVLVVPLLPVAARVPGEIGRAGDAVAVAAGLQRVHRAGLEALAPLAAGVAWLVFCGAAVALVWAAARGRLGAGAVAAVALGLTALDLFRFGMGENPAIPLDHARQPVTGAIRVLQSHRPARFAGVVPDAGLVPLPADNGMRYGLYDARSYDYPVERRYDRLWRAAVAPKIEFFPPTTLAKSDDRALRVLGLLGVRDLLQQTSDRPLSLPLAYDGREARIYANPHVQPRTWVVDRQRTVRGEDAALGAVTGAGFDPRAAAVVERPVAGIASGGGGAGAAAGSARLARYDPERVTVEASARDRSLVVLSDVWFPGWKATVDGRAAPVERVDYLLRGVAVPAGRHTVELRYAPASFRAGWIVSALTALGLLGWVLVARRRSRRA